MSAIQTAALSKSFGDFIAVQPITFEVEDGEIFGLLGPNGAGKSTLIRTLTTLLLPSSGTALVNGCDIRRDPNGVRKSIGVVPQAATSDGELTARENLEFFAKLHRVPRPVRHDMVDRLLASVDLYEWRDKLVGTFSGGMRRRLEIARSLVHQPKIFFLDEPTSGLDPASRLAMWRMLRRLQRHTALTIFLTTHYLEEADELCDRVAIFDRGSIVALDTPDRLKAEVPGEDYIEVQFGGSPFGWKEALGDLQDVHHVQFRNGTSILSTGNRTRTMADLLELARSRGWTLSSLIVRGRSLEDVFVHFVGRDTRDSTAARARLDVRYLYEPRK